MNNTKALIFEAAINIFSNYGGKRKGSKNLENLCIIILSILKDLLK
ncbi:MAG: hypothetical protein H7Y18_16860 [Clostridiaceae bacterium]|nr:hypothetical protein [Clostridiaceae bacterium]